MLAVYFSMLWIGRLMNETLLEQQNHPIKIVDFLTGGNSGVKAASTKLIQTREEWAQTWEQNQFYQVLGNAPSKPIDPDQISDLPPIDFDNTEIVAVFWGDAKNLSGFKVLGQNLVEKADVIFIAPAQLSAGAASAITRPFAFIQVTREKRELDIELQTGVDGEGNPIFKQIGQFQKPKAGGH